MPTQCSAEVMQFARLDGRKVVADFGGGAITTQMGTLPGSLLLGATDQAIGLVDRFAACFTDGRLAERVVHDVRTLVGQRVFAIALGYEDVNDHDTLRRDPVLGPVLGRMEARRSDCTPVGLRTAGRQKHAEPLGARPLPATGRQRPLPQDHP